MFLFFVLTLLYLLKVFIDTKKKLPLAILRICPIFKDMLKKINNHKFEKKHKPGYLTKSVYRSTFFRIYLFFFVWQPCYFVPDRGRLVSGFIRPCTRFARRDSIYSVVVFIDFSPSNSLAKETNKSKYTTVFFAITHVLRKISLKNEKQTTSVSVLQLPRLSNVKRLKNVFRSTVQSQIESRNRTPELICTIHIYIYKIITINKFSYSQFLLYTFLIGGTLNRFHFLYMSNEIHAKT